MPIYTAQAAWSVRVALTIQIETLFILIGHGLYGPYMHQARALCMGVLGRFNVAVHVRILHVHMQMLI